MAKLTRTWWGTKFMDALTEFMESGRLVRGRSYSGDNRVLSFSIKDLEIKAKIRGNKNSYFGVYKEPKYKVFLRFTTISPTQWSKIIEKISSNVGLMSKLVLNEMPDNIEDVFASFGESFLPSKTQDIISECSCPDGQNPCKHIAGIYFKVASILDRDPFLMFQLRGISKDNLYKELKKTDLGKALIASFSKKAITFREYESFYTSAKVNDFNQNINMKNFWNGSQIIDHPISEDELVSAILIKKQADYPAFWHKDNSFISAMESVYDFVRKKNKSIL